jgi:drug/metabolite transporter (DMT)-like permease
VVILGVMVVIGSSTATAAKFAVADLPIPLLPVFRFGVAGLALLPWLGGVKAIRKMLRKDLGLLLAAAALAVPVNQGFFLNGTRLAPTTHVGLIYASCPLVVLGLALLLRQERLDTARLAGIGASVAGAAVIAYGSLLQRGTGAEGAATLTGDLLLLGAVTSWGGYVTLNKRLVGRHPSIAVLGVTFLIGAILSLPAALWTAPRWLPTLADTRPQAWSGLLYLTLVASVLGLACQSLALRRLDASHLAAVGNLSPVLTVFWGVWLLGEAMTPSLAVGGALSLAGVAVAGRAMGSRGSPVLEPRCPCPVREAPAGAPAG